LNHLPPRGTLDHWRDYHAQLVMAGKHYCRNRDPRCADCPRHPLLPARLSRGRSGRRSVARHPS
jgi:endonuclease-3 related protein